MSSSVVPTPGRKFRKHDEKNYEHGYEHVHHKTGKCHFRAGMKVAFIGKFYDNVTPFATGGQPMQIYYLNKKGLTGGTSSAVIMIKYFAWMFCGGT